MVIAPLSLLIKTAGRRSISLPEPLLDRVLGRFGLPKLPVGAINHLKFPVVVDGSYFQRSTGFEHRFDEDQTMESFRWA